MMVRASKALFIIAFLMWGGAAERAGAQETSAVREADRDDLVSQSVVVLRTLDKVTARITEIMVPVGDRATVGTLEIFPRYCRTRPPIEPPESFAYLEIDDVGLRDNAERWRVFDGWMVASSPALNPLEHPVYDVWVIDCITVSPEASSGN